MKTSAFLISAMVAVGLVGGADLARSSAEKVTSVGGTGLETGGSGGGSEPPGDVRALDGSPGPANPVTWTHWPEEYDRYFQRGGGRLAPPVTECIPYALVSEATEPHYLRAGGANRPPRFQRYTEHYFGPHFDWRWFKAQAIAESGLQPNAESPAGARGIMQILPSTYREIKADNPHFLSIDEPRWNIAAGIYYYRMLYRKWQKGLPTEERLAFALASYNAGYGNVRKALKRAERGQNPVQKWDQVAPYAPGETRYYVRRIQGLMAAL